MALDINNNVSYSGVFIQSPDNRRRVQEQEGIQESVSIKDDANIDLRKGTQSENTSSIEQVTSQDSQDAYAQKAQLYETAKNYFDDLKTSEAKLGKAAVYVQTANQGNRQAAQDMLGFETYA